jgi:hypothetical protein
VAEHADGLVVLTDRELTVATVSASRR